MTWVRTSSVRFDVPGVPTPQGSKTRTRFGMREDNPRTRPWRDAVAWHAAQALSCLPPETGPVELEVVFRFPRPKSHYGTGRNADTLKPNAPEYVTGKPDLDKLVRAVGDALTGAAVRDDSQVAVLSARKVYGAPGVTVVVWALRGSEVAAA